MAARRHRMRSTAKPLQALPFIEHEDPKDTSYTPEIAILCASHSGTDSHVAAVRSIQAKAGLHEAELLCGTHPISHKPTLQAMQERGEMLSANRNNCSGKHTGMLAFTRLLDNSASPENLPYIDHSHPVQQKILQTFAEMSGLNVEQVKIGIDGCSAPNFAIPLRNAAWAFARLCDPDDLDARRMQACRTITSAMITHPDMVGGPDSFDTHLMQSTHGRIVSKGGAEGYQMMGLMPGALGPGSPALGIAIKISEGDLKSHTRQVGDARGSARPAVSLEVLRQLGALTQAELAQLSEYGPGFSIENWRKIKVGQGRTCFTLQIDHLNVSPAYSKTNIIQKVYGTTGKP
jgi:L-asparaginase II